MANSQSLIWPFRNKWYNSTHPIHWNTYSLRFHHTMFPGFHSALMATHSQNPLFLLQLCPYLLMLDFPTALNLELFFYLYTLLLLPNYMPISIIRNMSLFLKHQTYVFHCTDISVLMCPKVSFCSTTTHNTSFSHQKITNQQTNILFLPLLQSHLIEIWSFQLLRPCFLEASLTPLFLSYLLSSLLANPIGLTRKNISRA